jgi:predicted 2-oxoglutarate/Fe(II)-dependent dioxygenase YbiX
VIGGAVSEMLVLLCNDPALLRAIEAITGCTPVTRFNGSIYRMLPVSEHRQQWHDDLIDGRVLTLSINIGSSSYDGGLLEIRDRATRATIAQVPNTTPGDAVLFELDRSLEHRVTPVTNGVKTAFAGWFRRGMPLRDELRKASIELDSRLAGDSGIRRFQGFTIRD